MPPCRVSNIKLNPWIIVTTGVEVSASVLYRSMFLAGYIAGPDDELANPGGDGFDRLHG